MRPESENLSIAIAWRNRRSLDRDARTARLGSQSQSSKPDEIAKTSITKASIPRLQLQSPQMRRRLSQKSP
jgi:hypothetical protein